MWPKANIVGSVVWCLVCISSCHKTPPLRTTVELSSAYRRALLSATAHDSLYNQVDRRMEIFAVLFTPSFRSEFSRRYQDLFSIDISSGKGELEESFLSSGGKLAALVLMECEDYRLCEIGRGDSVWKLLLETGTQTLLPRKIRRLRTPRPTIQAFFPFTGNFHQVFWVVWPLEIDKVAEPCRLVVTSPYGKVKLSWPVAGGES